MSARVRLSDCECVCGGTIRQVALPPEIARLADRRFLWVHVSTLDTKCYPDDEVTAEPYDRATPTTPIADSGGTT